MNLAVGVITAVIAFWGFVEDQASRSFFSDSTNTTSVELGISELSPRGHEGGYAMPASVASVPHSCTISVDPSTITVGGSANATVLFDEGNTSQIKWIDRYIDRRPTAGSWTTIWSNSTDVENDQSHVVNAQAGGLTAGGYEYRARGVYIEWDPCKSTTFVKDEGDVCVGGWGTGSKSLSCTDTFTVNTAPDDDLKPGYLRVDGAPISGLSLVPGSSVNIQHQVVNSGNAASGNYRVYVNIRREEGAGNWIARFSDNLTNEPGLAAGGSKNYTKNWILPAMYAAGIPDQYRAEVWIFNPSSGSPFSTDTDALAGNDRLPISDYFYFTVFAEDDLYPENPTVNGANPSGKTYTTGQQLDLRSVVRNGGNATSEQYRFRFRITRGGTYLSSPGEVNNQSAIVAGGSTVYTYDNWVPTVAGNYTIETRVEDVGAYVRYSGDGTADTNDYSTALAFTVVDPPADDDLTPEYLNFNGMNPEGRTYYAGDVINITSSVKNIGSAASLGHRVYIDVRRYDPGPDMVFGTGDTDFGAVYRVDEEQPSLGAGLSRVYPTDTTKRLTLPPVLADGLNPNYYRASVRLFNSGTGSMYNGDTDSSQYNDYLPPFITNPEQNFYFKMVTQCTDGFDNADIEDNALPAGDGTFLADANDPGCHTDGDANNAASYNPNDNNETDPTGDLVPVNLVAVHAVGGGQPIINEPMRLAYTFRNSSADSWTRDGARAQFEVLNSIGTVIWTSGGINDRNDDLGPNVTSATPHERTVGSQHASVNDWFTPTATGNYTLRATIQNTGPLENTTNNIATLAFNVVTLDPNLTANAPTVTGNNHEGNQNTIVGTVTNNGNEISSSYNYTMYLEKSSGGSGGPYSTIVQTYTYNGQPALASSATKSETVYWTPAIGSGAGWYRVRAVITNSIDDSNPADNTINGSPFEVTPAVPDLRPTQPPAVTSNVGSPTTFQTTVENIGDLASNNYTLQFNVTKKKGTGGNPCGGPNDGTWTVPSPALGPYGSIAVSGSDNRSDTSWVPSAEGCYNVSAEVITTDSNSSNNVSGSRQFTVGTVAASAPDLVATPNIVRVGDSSALTWSLNGNVATDCSLRKNNIANVFAVPPGLPSATGPHNVSPTTVVEYTLTCPGGSDSVLIEVLPIIFES